MNTAKNNIDREKVATIRMILDQTFSLIFKDQSLYNIEVVTNDKDNSVTFYCDIHDSVFGLLIGKQGDTIKAFIKILTLFSASHDVRYHIEATPGYVNAKVK